jgi:hypothetical protein
VTREEQIAKVKERVENKAVVVQRVLATQDGQALLLILKEEFLFDARRGSEHGPAFRLGQCDVIGYIEQLNNHKKG